MIQDLTTLFLILLFGRVLGKQVVAPHDPGYHFTPTTTTGTSTSITPRPSTSGTLELNLSEHDLSFGPDTQGWVPFFIHPLFFPFWSDWNVEVYWTIRYMAVFMHAAMISPLKMVTPSVVHNFCSCCCWSCTSWLLWALVCFAVGCIWGLLCLFGVETRTLCWWFSHCGCLNFLLSPASVQWVWQSSSQPIVGWFVRVHQPGLCLAVMHQPDLCFVGVHQPGLCLVLMHQPDLCFVGVHQPGLCFVGVYQPGLCFVGVHQPGLCFVRVHWPVPCGSASAWPVLCESALACALWECISLACAVWECISLACALWECTGLCFVRVRWPVFCESALACTLWECQPGLCFVRVHHPGLCFVRVHWSVLCESALVCALWECTGLCFESVHQPALCFVRVHTPPAAFGGHSCVGFVGFRAVCKASAKVCHGSGSAYHNMWLASQFVSNEEGVCWVMYSLISGFNLWVVTRFLVQCP